MNLVSVCVSEEVMTEVKRRSEGDSLELSLLEHGSCLSLGQGGGGRGDGGGGGRGGEEEGGGAERCGAWGICYTTEEGWEGGKEGERKGASIG